MQSQNGFLVQPSPNLVHWKCQYITFYCRAFITGHILLGVGGRITIVARGNRETNSNNFFFRATFQIFFLCFWDTVLAAFQCFLKVFDDNLWEVFRSSCGRGAGNRVLPIQKVPPAVWRPQYQPAFYVFSAFIVSITTTTVVQPSAIWTGNQTCPH